jgi:hypothetical protein
MDDCKLCVTPFELGIKLTNKCLSLEVNTTLYQQWFGSLIYLTHSWLDLSFVVSVVSKFIQDPQERHWKDAKSIAHYIKCTTDFRIKYCRSLDSLVRFSDSNWVGNGDDHKSTSNYVFHFSFEPPVWLCNK